MEREKLQDLLIKTKNVWGIFFSLNISLNISSFCICKKIDKLAY
jgi:hypothetical protein